MQNPVTSVPLLDLAAQNGPLRAELLAAIARVVDSGRFILGPEVEALRARARRDSAPSTPSACRRAPTRCCSR